MRLSVTMDDAPLTTWDGLARAAEAPFGATVIVYALTDEGPRFLLLRRSHVEVDSADWAWTPPAGCRHLGESIEACAARELLEETGIDARPLPTTHGSDDWPAFVLRVEPGTPIKLDHEHAHFDWFDVEQVAARCKPAVAHAPVSAFAATLG